MFNSKDVYKKQVLHTHLGSRICLAHVRSTVLLYPVPVSYTHLNPAPGALDGGDMLTKADLKLADEYINSTYIQITKGATDTVVGSRCV